MCPLGGRLWGGLDAKLVAHCLLVEAPTGLLLVDTGIGLGDIQRPARLGMGFVKMARPVLDERETALRQIERLGYSADDVRDIVLTHMDPDHAGALGDFPKATVHVYETEYRAAMAPTLAETPRYRAAQWAHSPAWWPHRASGERWFGLECVRQLEGLPPELLIVPLAGHTRGHAGVAIARGDKWLLHAGDAYFSRHELRTPDKGAKLLRAFQYLDAFDNRVRLQNREHLRALHRAHADAVQIFCSHDPVELEELRAATAQG